jgi:glucose/arabinose dehydrogenase/PKD repeat protein
MRHLITAIAAAVFITLLPSHQLSAAPVDGNFTTDIVNSGAGRTKIEFDPAGRLYLTEKRGRLLQCLPNGSGGFLAPVVLLDLQSVVNWQSEGGLLGMALDPDFANNRFLYLFYTTATDQRLVRHTLNPAFSGMEPGSATVLLSGLPRQTAIHKAGEIAIHPDDPYHVVIALGDDGVPARAQNLDFYEGKILRVDSSTGRGAVDNPWFDGNPDSIRSRIWARGLRNPFRFAFHPARADVIIVSENGDSTDRVAWVKKGSNGAWGTGGDNGGFLNPPDPDFRVMHTNAPSLIGISIATSGPFAHNGNPTLYLGEWFPVPWGVRRFTLSGPDLSVMTGIPDGQGGNWWEQSVVAVDLEFGPDGHLYFTETGGGEAAGDWHNLRRFRFASGSPPLAAFTMSPAGGSGEAPLEIGFTDGSTPGTRPIASRTWNFGDGQTSTLQNPTHIYQSPGRYTVTLSVTDTAGLSVSTSKEIVATLTTPVSLDLTVLDARALPAVPAASAIPVAIYQRDGSTPVSFSGGSGAAGNFITIPAGGSYSGNLDLPLTGDGFVMVIGEGNSAGFQAMTRGFSIPAGTAALVETAAWLSDTALRGSVRTVAGEPAAVDLGVTSGGMPVAFGGGRDSRPDSYLPTVGVKHRTVADSLGYFYIGLPTALGGSSFTLTLAEDSGRERFTSIQSAALVPAYQAVDRDLILGEWRAGPGDDLSGIPVTPNVSFSAVQAIFSNQCIGCHRDNTNNNGGLDLTEGNSHAGLVNQPSRFVPGLKLVDPGNPERSYLFEKINRAVPQQGARMRPSDAMIPADQARIRDWIAQLAPTYESYVRGSLLGIPGAPGTGVADDFDGDGRSNGLAYSGFEPAAIEATEGTATLDCHINPDVSGLTLAVQASDELQPGSWKTLAAWLRGGNSWKTAPGVTVQETQPGSIRIVEITPGSSRRFYRTAIAGD